MEDNSTLIQSITYYLYTEENPNDYVQLNQSNWDLLSNKRIVFLIHGWMSSKEADWYEDLKNAFLANYLHYSVVQVDWNQPASQLYTFSSRDTEYVGHILASLLIDLNANHNVRLADILLVGHSLGAHIIGFVGKDIYESTGLKLPRIIALDPAGPLFLGNSDDKRLSKEDAEVVVVIHTDDKFGYKDALGTVDFFVNGGTSQPGCKEANLTDIKTIINAFTCDHLRAYQYFAEALIDPKQLVAEKCADWDTYKEHRCNDQEEVGLGDLAATVVGNFYLETNEKKPFTKSAIIK